MRTGRHLGRIPFIAGGGGPRHAVVLFGAHALIQPLDRTAPARHARLAGTMLPEGYRYALLGYDDRPPPDYGFAGMVDDFATVLAGYAEPPDVIGVSFGGFVAQRLAAEHPHLLRRLVLLVSAHRFSASGWARVQHQEALMRQGDLHGFVRELALLFRRPWLNAATALGLWLQRRELPGLLNDPQCLLRLYANLFTGFDNTPPARRIRTPTLVVGATRDQFFDVAAYRETAALIPHARLHLFPDETHLVPLERPRLVRAVLEDFLAENAPE